MRIELRDPQLLGAKIKTARNADGYSGFMYAMTPHIRCEARGTYRPRFWRSR
jgi:hypothetical protein